MDRRYRRAHVVKLPKNVQLGGHTIPNRRKKLAKYAGYFEPDTLTIVIDSDATPSIAWETLYHEIIDALNWLGEYNLPHQTIQQLGVWLHQAVESMELKQ